MCGISGYFSPSNKFTPTDLKIANDAIAHRGPDSDGFYNDEIVGLGHRRLSIIDLRAVANQPMTSANNRFVAVYNGEVYNFEEIKQEILKVRPEHVFKTTSDTEVIIEAFALWRENFVEKMNGMFALAIYDKESKTLFIFRDRIGIKPIYYFWDGSNLFFASELKAIKTLKSKIALSLNKEAVNHFLHLGYIPAPHSIFNHVFKLFSGNYIKINATQFDIMPYWRAKEKIKPAVISNEVEAKKQLKDLLISSVKYRMISDVPFGTFLSGGIDSSVVTAIAQSISSEPVKTFSIGIEDSKQNESGYAQSVADYLKTSHHPFSVKESDAIEMVEKLDDVYDEPFSDTSFIPTMIVSRLARKHVTMVLSGDGGDELFMGYGAYQWAKRLQHPMAHLVKSPLSLLFSKGNSKYKRIAEMLNTTEAENIHSHIFSQEQNLFAHRELKKILSKTLYQKTISSFDLYFQNRDLSPTEQQAFFDLNYYLQDDLLVKVDRATMHYSLEARVPILDYRIIEFALNLDENLKIKNKQMKYLLKQVLYDYVPQSFFDRPKWGFSVPMHKWLKNELKYLVEKYVTKEMCERYELINWHYAQIILNDFYKKNDERLYNRIWLIICLHRFMEKNF